MKPIFHTLVQRLTLTRVGPDIGEWSIPGEWKCTFARRKWIVFCVLACRWIIAGRDSEREKERERERERERNWRSGTSLNRFRVDPFPLQFSHLLRVCFKLYMHPCGVQPIKWYKRVVVWQKIYGSIVSLWNLELSFCPFLLRISFLSRRTPTQFFKYALVMTWWLLWRERYYRLQPIL